ncbi:uncharacterized protein LOC128253328 [Drosophila gunungcola]|uniref:Uncharacterized protein n=1 Tax=Drosophila gunungcola TaxID=103775 RepID=A0A9P9YK19_9MUSC|nr:uncharacterized protein LOC128253328 [Drosophila gunungcola]KAI8038130.1 hypothetical protein M5D96_009171 [Drosophila gunungcola]
MLGLRNGIFAGSLLGSGSCFQRLAPCTCRSSQKPQPRFSAKKPFKPQLASSSGSEENRRLLALMETGCRCPHRSTKERWFFTNRHIILSLATVLNRPPDLVTDFLHSLTLQNFSQILKPSDPPGIFCKVPYVNCCTCENYMRIFDAHGNVRSRFTPDSLELLMRAVQTVLRQDSLGQAEPFDLRFGAQHRAIERASKAKRAGIDRDSIARKNGKRRLRVSEARAYETTSRLHSGLKETTIGDPGYIFGLSLEPIDFDVPIQRPETWALEDAQTSERIQRLGSLLRQVNEKTYLTSDAGKLITAIKNLEWDSPAHNRKPSTTDNEIIKRLSDSYYERVKASGSKAHLKKKTKSSKISLTKVDHPTLGMQKSRISYGEAIPVLLHEPFDKKKPWTWMRRHPNQIRMNDLGEISHGSTLDQFMQEEKERSSVHTVISTDLSSKAAKIRPKFGQKKSKSRSRHFT